MCTRCVVDDIFAAACRAPFEVAELRDDGGVSRRATDLELNSGNAAWYIFFGATCLRVAWPAHETEVGSTASKSGRGRVRWRRSVRQLGGEAPEQGR